MHPLEELRAAGEDASLVLPAGVDREAEGAWHRGVGADADAAAATEAVPRAAGVGAGPSVPSQSPFPLNYSDWCCCCCYWHYRTHRRPLWSSRKEM